MSRRCSTTGLKSDYPQPIPATQQEWEGLGDGLTEKAVWHVVREYARKAAIERLAPAGGELERIQFLLGHVSIQTTERYLGCKQRIQSAVNDRISIEPEV